MSEVGSGEGFIRRLWSKIRGKNNPPTEEDNYMAQFQQGQPINVVGKKSDSHLGRAAANAALAAATIVGGAAIAPKVGEGISSAAQSIAHTVGEGAAEVGRVVDSRLNAELMRNPQSVEAGRKSAQKQLQDRAIQDLLKQQDPRIKKAVEASSQPPYAPKP